MAVSAAALGREIASAMRDRKADERDRLADQREIDAEVSSPPPHGRSFDQQAIGRGRPT